MIPKKIHYCWFGGKEKSRLTKKCIKSWENFCPEYSIIEWNENNFDINQHPYLVWCYENKKWAFLSDFARLIIVNENGGIYLDTDVELIRKPDELLNYSAFFCFENSKYVNTGLGFGAEKKQAVLTEMMHAYNDLKVNEDGTYPLIVCPKLNTEALLSFGLKLNGMRQNIAGAEILPVEYLNPYDDQTGVLNKTDKTISIHWYSKAWLDKKTILRSKVSKPLHRFFGVDCFRGLRK